MKLKQIILSLLVGTTLGCGEMNKENKKIDLVDKPIISEPYQNIELNDAFDSEEYLQLGFIKDTYSNGQHLWGYILKVQGKNPIYASSEMSYYKSLELVLNTVEEKVGTIPATLIIDNDFNGDGNDDLSKEEIATVITGLKAEKVAYLK